ncbi:MAG: zinc-dependent alcohol dehydrogenase [Armatimonadota bacterium]
MLAARLYDRSGTRTLVLETMPDPQPGKGEVLIRIRAAGICGTDREILDGLRLPSNVPWPIVPGHEVAGEIVQVGEDTNAWRVGDRVLVDPYIACGRCWSCLDGRQSACLSPEFIGLTRQGGFAEMMTVPAVSLFRLPDVVPFPVGAILPDAVATAFHALMGRGELQPGQSVVVYGAGGVGTHGVMLAKMFGADPLIVVVRRKEAADRLQALGAQVVIARPDGSPVREIRRMTGGRGVDLCVDFVAKSETVRACIGAARIGGRVVLVGVSDESLILPGSSYLVRREVEIRSAFGATPHEMATVIGLAASGRLDLSHSVSGQWPLARIHEAMGALLNRPPDAVRFVVSADIV